MFRSLKLGKLFGIPVYVHPTFFLLPLWILVSGWGEGLAVQAFSQLLLVALFGCVVLHEFGHALAARYFGIRTRDVTLYPIGGVARLEGMGERPTQELVIALAGPAVNVVIAALLTPLVILFVAGGSFADGEFLVPLDGGAALLGSFVSNLWVLNIGLVLFNMIPAFPMDGGRVLRAALAAGLGQLRATEIATKVGLVAAGFLGIAGLYFHRPTLFLVAGFVALVGQSELNALRWRESQRRLARDAGPLVVDFADDAPPRPVRPAGFSGVLWDGRYGVWVQWRDGRPVAFWGQAE
jgi:Zn-dependent protease